MLSQSLSTRFFEGFSPYLGPARRPAGLFDRRLSAHRDRGGSAWIFSNVRARDKQWASVMVTVSDASETFLATLAQNKRTARSTPT